MSLFLWYKTYSVNNEELDTHHMALLNIINRLNDNCLGKDKPANLEPIIEELVAYSNYHFSAEEQHMRNLGYEGLDKHIIEHRSFTQKILRLQNVANKNELELTKNLIVFLGNWICHHIIEEDKKFSI